MLAVLTLCTAIAQENSIRILLDELAQLNGEDVEYELVSDSMINGFIDQIEAMTATDSGHKLFITEYATISSTTPQGYSQICSILDKYDVSATEELFGIPLINNVRAEGEQQIIFADSEHSLIITEDFDQQHVLIAYTNGNIINFSQLALMGILNGMCEYFTDTIRTEDGKTETVHYSREPAIQVNANNQPLQTSGAVQINSTRQRSGEVRPKTPAVDKEKSRQVMPKSSPKK